MKTIAKTKHSELHGSVHVLMCCLCGENDRNKLIVEDIGLCIGMSGQDYSFCKKCWSSRDLGKKILKLVGYPDGMKILDERLDLQVCDD